MSELSTADRAAIVETLSRMCRGTDAEDLEELVGCWAPDGVWDSGMFPAVDGRDAIRAFFEGFFADDSLLHVRRGQHWLRNHVFDVVEPDRVVVWSNWAFFHAGDGTPGPKLAGSYEDTLVRDGERWLLARREITNTMAAAA